MAIIAIDIDDTITDSSEVVSKYAYLYDSKYSNEKILINNLDTILRGFFNHDAIINFFKDYAIKIAEEVKVKKDAVRVINEFKSEGHSIYIITARSDNYYKNSYDFCKNYLDKNGIKYDKLITSKIYKVNTCIDEKVDIMIDDGVDTCDDLNNKGIKAFLFTSSLNKDKESISKRVNNWSSVYDEVNLYLKEKANQ